MGATGLAMMFPPSRVAGMARSYVSASGDQSRRHSPAKASRSLS